MPVPTKLPAHRTACKPIPSIQLPSWERKRFNEKRKLLGFALYRAFLSHIPHIPLEPAQTQFAEWYIRSEFKRNQNARGIKPVRKALSYARKVLPLSSPPVEERRKEEKN